MENIKLYNKNMDFVTNKIIYCNKVIEDFKKNNGFDPLSALQGTENKTQKLYSLCVDYVYQVEKLTEKLEKDIKKCI